jgi:hypothetical protein
VVAHPLGIPVNVNQHGVCGWAPSVSGFADCKVIHLYVCTTFVGVGEFHVCMVAYSLDGGAEMCTMCRMIAHKVRLVARLDYMQRCARMLVVLAYPVRVVAQPLDSRADVCGWLRSLRRWLRGMCGWLRGVCGWLRSMCGWLRGVCGSLRSLCRWLRSLCGWLRGVCGWLHVMCGWLRSLCGWLRALCGYLRVLARHLRVVARFVESVSDGYSQDLEVGSTRFGAVLG